MFNLVRPIMFYTSYKSNIITDVVFKILSQPLCPVPSFPSPSWIA